MANKNSVGLKAMCLLLGSKRKILLGKGYDKVKRESFYRVLGGSLNQGESPEEGIRREIQEELNCGIKNLKFLDTIENRFVYEGENRCEIVHLFLGNVSDVKFESQKTVHIIEEKYEFDAEWVPINDVIEEQIVLYPVFNYKKFLQN